MTSAINKQLSRQQQIEALELDWAQNPRWKSVKRGYSAADVVRLRGSVQPDYTYAQNGARTLWDKVNGGAKKGYVNAFGAITAGQAMQQAKAGLEAVYLSGWQVAADGNTSETMYPDQSLYAYDSVPTMVRRINNTFKRADEIQWSRGIEPGSPEFIDYFLPMWPHFFTAANWSSKCTPAAPAAIMFFISSKALRTPPKPASASATMGRK